MHRLFAKIDQRIVATYVGGGAAASPQQRIAWPWLQAGSLKHCGIAALRSEGVSTILPEREGMLA